ncbi:MAG: LamG-like jellyroll fold domain-containing protein, partial [Verrucomicrobiales bacterium]
MKLFRHFSHRLSPSILWRTAWAGMIASSIFSPCLVAQNYAIYLPRTEASKEWDNTLDTDSISRKGGAAIVNAPSGADKTSIAFWLQRDLAEDAENAFNRDRTNRTWVHSFDESYNDVAAMIHDDTLPDDENWHFFLFTVEATTTGGNTYDWKAYIDGSSTPIGSGNFTSAEGKFGGLWIGSGVSSMDRDAFDKYSSNSNLLLDDFMVWNDVSQNRFDNYAEIARFGMENFKSVDPELVYHRDCNHESDVPYFAIDSGVKNPKKNDLGDAVLSTLDETPTLAPANGSRRSKVRVEVDSTYVSGISPRVGLTIHDYDSTERSTLTFSAPAFIYLDRYRTELGSSDDADLPGFIDQAFYRMRNVGYAIKVGANPISQGSDTFFSQPLTDDMNVTWKWEEEYALIIQSATADLTEADAPVLGEPTVNGAPSKVGKHWIPAGTLVRTAIDALINDETQGTAIPERFETRGYTIENAPGGGDRYLAFNGSNSLMDVPTIDIPDLGNFSVEFWARRDSRETTTDEELVILNTGTADSPTPLVRIGVNAANDLDNPKGMFLAIGSPDAAAYRGGSHFLANRHTGSIRGPDHGAQWGAGSDIARTWGFWLKADQAEAGTNISRIAFEVHMSERKRLLQFGLRPPSHATNPGGYFYVIKNSDDFTELQTVEITSPVRDGDWHYWSIVTDQSDQKIYADGALIHAVGSPLPFTSTINTNMHTYGTSGFESDSWLNGEMDDVRIWTSALSDQEIADAMAGQPTVQAAEVLSFEGGSLGNSDFAAYDESGTRISDSAVLTEDPLPPIAQIPASLLDDAWHHWAWVLDELDSTLLCYRDGEVVGTFPGISFEGVAYTNYSSDGVFPSYPETDILTGDHVIEAEDFDSTVKWHIEDSPGEGLPTSGGKYAAAPIVDSVNTNLIEYTGLSIPAGTYRLVTRSASSSKSELELSINGNTVMTYHLVDAIDGDWTNSATPAFTINEPITDILITWTPGTELAVIDQFRLQVAVDPPATASGAQLAWTPIAAGIQTGLLLPPNLAPTYSAADLSCLLGIEEAGTYEFQLTSLGGSVLAIDGVTVVDNDGIHGSAQSQVGSISLAQGFRSLSVEFFQTNTPSSLEVAWNPPNDDPDLGFIPIPDDLLTLKSSIVSAQVGNRSAQDLGFSGGMNNLRLWTEALGEDEITAAAATSVYGPGTSNLAMEFSFDSANLSTQISDDSNHFQGILHDFGTWDPNTALALTGDGVIVLDPTVAMTQPYTLEALVSFPLPVSPGGYRTLFRTEATSGGGAPIVVDSGGELGALDESGTFHGSEHSILELDGWHMVSAVGDGDSTTYYIDGVQVGTVDFAPNQPLQYIGNDGGGSQAIGIIDEVRLWDRPLSASEIADKASVGLTGTELNLVGLWNFDDGTAADGTPNGHDGAFENGATIVPASLNPGPSEQLTALYPEFSSQVRSTSDALDGSVHTDDIAMQDWLRVIWTWHRTLRLNVTASPPDLQDLVFLEVDGELYHGDAAAEIWIPTGRDVVVGTQYRSSDRCFTLDLVSGQQNAFQVVTMDTVEDGSAASGAATRESKFLALEEPGSLVFRFSDTVYHAVLPLGEGLDVSSLDALNAQIVPDLCVGGLLDVSKAPPQQTASVQFGQGASGDSTEWDFPNQRFYVVQPAVITNLWPDIDPLVSGRTIMIASGFPTSTIDTPWWIEDDEGYRLDIDGNRIMSSGQPPTRMANLAPVSDEFPGSPVAHYNYLAGSNTDPDTDQTIPCDLDDDATDRWFFERASFFGNRASVDSNLKRFTANAEGQSVLVYRYREDPAQIATGNPDLEGVAVRVVNALPLADHTEAGEQLASQNHRELRLASDIGRYVGPTASGDNYGVGSNADRTWDFWAKVDPDPSDPSKKRVIFEIDSIGGGFLTQFGVRETSHATNPGGYYYTVQSGTNGSDLAPPIEFGELTPDHGWHHWAIAVGGAGQSFYLDGNLIYSTGNAFPVTLGSDNIQSYGYSKKDSDYWMEGTIDNWRIWTTALDTDQVREAMRVRGGITNVDPVFAVSFDGTTDGNIIQKDFGIANGDLEVLDPSQSVTPVAGDVLFPQDEDGFAEVASRLDSKLDTGDLGAGFVINPISNYNPTLYDRGELVGQWGEVFPVNWGGLYSGNKELIIAYYENPYLAQPDSTTILHPNVAWPYAAIDYMHVDYPTLGEDKDKRIYIASRLGSEGVDANALDQFVVDPEVYTGLAVYNQPVQEGVAGYNPNEEHALIAPSIKAQLTGDSTYKLGQSAAFALQVDLNRTNRYTDPPTNASVDPSYTSDPWVLIQYQDIVSGEWDMAAYKVETTRTGGGDRANDLFPQL